MMSPSAPAATAHRHRRRGPSGPSWLGRPRRASARVLHTGTRVQVRVKRVVLDVRMPRSQRMTFGCRRQHVLGRQEPLLDRRRHAALEQDGLAESPTRLSSEKFWSCARRSEDSRIGTRSLVRFNDSVRSARATSRTSRCSGASATSASPSCSRRHGDDDPGVAVGRVRAGARNPNVILCERGIRTFEATTRFTSTERGAVVKKLSHLPVVVPDHGRATGTSSADGDGRCGGRRRRAHIEVHPRRRRRCPTAASLKPERFAALMQRVRRSPGVDRDL